MLNNDSFQMNPEKHRFLITSFSLVFPRRYLKRAHDCNQQQEASLASVKQNGACQLRKIQLPTLISGIASLVKIYFLWDGPWHLDSYYSLKSISIFIFSKLFLTEFWALVLPPNQMICKRYWPAELLKLTTVGQVWSFHRTVTHSFCHRRLPPLRNLLKSIH